MSKPRVAIFDFACCEGCQLQIVNMEQEILDVLTLIQPVEWREAISDHSETYDIAVIEGSITREEDAEKLRRIREKAKVLVALGACATIGGVNKLKNHFSMDDARHCVYGSAADLPHLNTMPTKSVGEIVKVDFAIHGCPISKREFGHFLRCIALGKAPTTPTYPVCVECKKNENVCRYEYNEICLGPLTRAGCGAKCPTASGWCFGCRGFLDDANLDAARGAMAYYNKTADDLKSRAVLFNI